MIKVLFVCHGNICRSTMAEFVMKNIVEEEGIEDSFYIESAGSSVYDPGSPVYPLAKDCLRRNGITNPEINTKMSRGVVKKDRDDFDYILVAEDDNLNGVLRVIGNDASDKVFKILDFGETYRFTADNVLVRKNDYIKIDTKPLFTPFFSK